MDFKRKLELVQASITNISRADDKDSAVRCAALDRIEAFIKAEREAIAARLAAKVESEVAEQKGDEK